MSEPAIDIDQETADRIEGSEFSVPLDRECPGCRCPRVFGDATVDGQHGQITTWRIFLYCDACERIYPTRHTYQRQRGGTQAH